MTNMNNEPTKQELVAALVKQWREIVEQQIANLRSVNDSNLQQVVEKAKELNAKLRIITSQIPEESMEELRKEFFSKTEEE